MLTDYISNVRIPLQKFVHGRHNVMNRIDTKNSTDLIEGLRRRAFVSSGRLGFYVAPKMVERRLGGMRVLLF